MKKPKTVHLNLKVPAEVAGWLHRARSKRKQTMSHVVREILWAAYEGRHAK